MQRFDKYLPTDNLKQFIKYFAISENNNSGAYKVLPDTSLVMGFQYKGNLSYWENNNEQKLSTAGITGLQDSFRIFNSSENIGSVLVYFTEIGAASFLRLPAHEIYSESIALDHLFDRHQLGYICEKLSESRTDSKRINIIEEFLLSQLQYTKPDLLIQSAVKYLYNSKGQIRIGDLAKMLNISQSPLEKRFRKIVGASPKKFASIIRLQSIIKEYKRSENMTEIAYRAGYYDQAHFIKDFKQFSGETPEKFLYHR